MKQNNEMIRETTWMLLQQHEKSEDDLNYAYQLGMLAFDESLWRKTGLVKGAGQTLDFLVEQNDELILLTKGDTRVQKKKIEVTGIKNWFGENIHIVPEKNEEVLSKYVNGRDKAKVWHVGNSIKSDV